MERKTKGAKVAQRVFVFVCAVFLLFPVVMFNWTGTESITEKRTLAVLPSILKNGGLNEKFFTDCDSWLKDRFGMRDALVKLYGLCEKDSMLSSNRNALFGKDGWLFYVSKDDGDNLADFFKENLFTNDELTKIVTNIKDRRNWCEKHNIKFLIVIAPNKHSVYGEYYPIKRPAGITRAEQIAFALEEAGVNFVFPRDILIANKTKYSVPLYYKTDTHWNALGALIAMHPIFEKISALFPGTAFPFSKTEFDVNFKETVGRGDIVAMTGRTIYHNDWSVSVSPNGAGWSNFYIYEKNNERNGIITHSNNASLPKAIIYRDSFCTSLEPLLSSQFYAAEYRWEMFKQDEKEYILSKKPDIVIWEWVERSTWRLKKL